MTIDSGCATWETPTGTIIRLLDHPRFKGPHPGSRKLASHIALGSFETALGRSNHFKRVPAFVLTGLIGIYAVILVDLCLRFLF